MQGDINRGYSVKGLCFNKFGKYQVIKVKPVKLLVFIKWSIPRGATVCNVPQTLFSLDYLGPKEQTWENMQLRFHCLLVSFL